MKCCSIELYCPPWPISLVSSSRRLQRMRMASTGMLVTFWIIG